MINDYIYDIYDILNIDIPNISYNTSHFATSTMLACCDNDGNTIYIKPSNKLNPDYLFAIAHKLRHIWQIKTNNTLYFSDYKPVDLCQNIDEYNLQLAEVDANAFAEIILTDMFSIKPLFQGMSDIVKDKIKQRIPITLNSIK